MGYEIRHTTSDRFDNFVLIFRKIGDPKSHRPRTAGQWPPTKTLRPLPSPQRPSGDVHLPNTLSQITDCNAQGAICTGERLMLSNRTELTAPGPGS